ncbi:hypothetical protein LLS1_13930 [Leifsonia sp. LS1]|uniref:hypothetical protein n=1 Tax=Leifsonia sp. LS1 TaxID=2828483 RepID=UPI001CFCEF5B|nr:hypothetical protein [Leifsonia sp. LS1]GIT79724.1 hypothetical protein LLS1_13930 [Leifsonia sp. LS1]
MGIYDELGITPLINAWGTVTAVGGSLMAPAVVDAMREASEAFVDLHLLHRRAGVEIARMLGVEAACVTSGAAAGITIAAAASAGLGGEADRPVLRDECVILRAHRSRYDRAVTVAGLRIVEVAAHGASDLRAAVHVRTALVLYVAEAEHAPGSLPLDVVAGALEGTGVPLAVDAAAELPPRSNLRRFLDRGADLVIVSGGKEIRGPQSSGLILGRQDLIAACTAIGFPNHGIGRGMKTDKETIAGLVRAVDLYVRRDEAAQFRAWDRMVEQIVGTLDAHPLLHARRHRLREAGIQPASIPRAYVTAPALPAEELAARLRAGDPAVAVGVDGDAIAINPQCLEPDQVPALIRAIVGACAYRARTGGH